MDPVIRCTLRRNIRYYHKDLSFCIQVPFASIEIHAQAIHVETVGLVCQKTDYSPARTLFFVLEYNEVVSDELMSSFWLTLIFQVIFRKQQLINYWTWSMVIGQF